MACRPAWDTIDIKHQPVNDKSGNVSAINVSVGITGKILNNSDYKEIDVSKINAHVTSELERLFEGQKVDPGGTIKWNVTITSNFTTVTNMDQVSASDHLIAIVDDVYYDEGLFSQSTIGVALRNSKIAYVEAAGSRRPDYHQMGTVAVHEFLHNMGLDDLYNKPKSEQIEGNYMMR
jgi:hypothetical protein